MGKKTIILGYGGAHGINLELIRNLEHLGFNVISVSLNRNFIYKSIFQKIENYLRKRFFNNTEVEKKQRLDPFLQDFYNKLNDNGGKADFALFIRPDDFPAAFLKKIKSKVNVMVGYQWDGFKIFPHARKCVKHFDRFFVFAPEDVDYAKNLIPTTNFYFDYLPERPKTTSGKSIYFFGTYIIYQMEMIALFTETIKKLGYEPNINILASRYDDTEKYKNTDIQFLTHGISFKENIQNAKDADILVDFVNGKHSGLSFRTFDAIGYDKKLITTNADVKKYDFYNPNNIFILEKNNLHELGDFLNRPYVMPNKEIKEKYIFTNWLHYVLDIQPYQKIELPKV